MAAAGRQADAARGVVPCCPQLPVERLHAGTSRTPTLLPDCAQSLFFLMFSEWSNEPSSDLLRLVHCISLWQHAVLMQGDCICRQSRWWVAGLVADQMER